MSQYIKDEIRLKIIDAAREEFLEKGFGKSSVRKITAVAKTSKSNLYNYFRDKDNLFCSVLGPTLKKIREGLEAVKQFNVPKSLDAYTKESQMKVVGVVYGFVAENIKNIRLLLFKSQGSSLEGFKQELLEKFTDNMCEWVKSINQEKDISRLFVRCVCNFYIGMVEQAILYGKPEEMQKFSHEFTDFIFYGWKGLLQ